MDETMPVTGVTRAAPTGESAELVVRNGRIFTGDSTKPSATSARRKGHGLLVETAIGWDGA